MSRIRADALWLENRVVGNFAPAARRTMRWRTHEVDKKRESRADYFSFQFYGNSPLAGGPWPAVKGTE